MQTKNHFSFQRFLLLIRLSVRVNKKLLLISVAGLAGTLFLALFLFQLMINFERWGQGNYMGTFFLLFLILGFLFTSQAFPAFRNNTKCQAFLMLPASKFRKICF